MEQKEISIETLSPEQLKPTDAQRLSLDPNESITLKVKTIKAYQTDFGILWLYLAEDDIQIYSVSSWNINLYPRPAKMTDLQDKLIKITNTGSKRYKCEWS